MSARGVEYGILGPLTVSLRGRELRLGGAKQRSVLAVLLLRALRKATGDSVLIALAPVTNRRGAPVGARRAPRDISGTLVSLSDAV
jgi:DNA-binding SARP family transcriptional activator